MERVKGLISMVLDEVDVFFKRNGYIPSQVMIPDKEYNLLRKKQIIYNDSLIKIVNCGRVVNEECYKPSKNRAH